MIEYAFTNILGLYVVFGVIIGLLYMGTCMTGLEIYLARQRDFHNQFIVDLFSFLLIAVIIVFWLPIVLSEILIIPVLDELEGVSNSDNWW